MNDSNVIMSWEYLGAEALSLFLAVEQAGPSHGLNV